MKILSLNTMISARFSTVAALIICALPSTATTTHSYFLSETVPCETRVCVGNLIVDGFITVDALGTLSESNFVSWDLSIGFQGNPPVTLNESNSMFQIFGSPQITATASQLTVVAASLTDDAIRFFNIQGQYLFAGTPGGHTVFYRDKITGFKQVKVPATLTISTFGHPGPDPAPVPEPATSVLMLLSTGLIFPALKRARR